MSKRRNLLKMPKLHEKYETMVVYSLKNGEEQITGLNQKFTSMIEAGAELISVNEWGKRRLAYPINYENDGYYVLYAFDCKPDFPKEFERVLNITEGVMRFLTVVRQEAPPKEEGDEAPAESTTPPPEIKDAGNDDPDAGASLAEETVEEAGE
jgi:small subunit ribosomal protein S6